MGVLRTMLNFIGRRKGYSGCRRCGDRWNWKQQHSTQFDGCHGCFPLCEECWQSLSVEDRMPYYMQLMDVWEVGLRRYGREWNQHRETRAQVRAAVLAGK